MGGIVLSLTPKRHVGAEFSRRVAHPAASRHQIWGFAKNFCRCVVINSTIEKPLRRGGGVHTGGLLPCFTACCKGLGGIGGGGVDTGAVVDGRHTLDGSQLFNLVAAGHKAQKFNGQFLFIGVLVDREAVPRFPIGKRAVVPPKGSPLRGAPPAGGEGWLPASCRHRAATRGASGTPPPTNIPGTAVVRRLPAGWGTPPYVQPIKRCAVGISGGFLCTSKSASPHHRGWRS